MSAVRSRGENTEADIGQAKYNTHPLHTPTPVVLGPPILAIVSAHLLVSCRPDSTRTDLVAGKK
jgi:hypothetical protein